jgi:hypothetical protein
MQRARSRRIDRKQGGGLRALLEAGDAEVVAPDIDAYFSFVLGLFLAFGLTFEVPIVVVLLALRRRPGRDPYTWRGDASLAGAAGTSPSRRSLGAAGSGRGPHVALPPAPPAVVLSLGTMGAPE